MTRIGEFLKKIWKVFEKMEKEVFLENMSLLHIFHKCLIIKL